MESHRFNRIAVFSTVGLGCFFAFVLVLLLGKMPFADFDLAFANQLPLTISGDAGCILGLAVVALVEKINLRGDAVEGYATAFASAGLCLSALARSGLIAGFTSQSLIAGDFLAGMFVMICAYCWWRIYAPWGESVAIQRMAVALAFGSAMFLALALLPAEFSRPASCIVPPLAMCLCFLPLVLHDSPYDPETKNERMHNAKTPVTNDGKTVPGFDAPSSLAIVLITVALSCFVVDLGMDLFPISLYHEPSPMLAFLASAPAETNSPIGTLTQPAAACAVLTMVFSGALYLLARRGPAPFFVLYFVGFVLTAFNYLAFPYHLVGGLPLGIAESGRIVIAVFVVAILLRVMENRTDACRVTRLFLVVAATALAAMLVADAIAIGVQMAPNFDYADFQFRTVFAGIGTAVLIVLILGPLPRLDAATSPLSEDASSATNDSIGTSLEERFEHVCAEFAADHALSARETEIFTLMAYGRDVPYIERELVLAKSTVKTHIKHIYEKCGVSSKQDLLDMFESYRS